MEASDLQQLRSFESDVRQLLKAYRKQESDLADLRNQLSARDEEIERLQSELRSSERAYSNLKLARMIEVSDSDLRTGRLRISRLVREVNKCIRLLSAEMDDIDDAQADISSEKESDEVSIAQPSESEEEKSSYDDAIAIELTSDTSDTSEDAESVEASAVPQQLPEKGLTKPQVEPSETAEETVQETPEKAEEQDETPKSDDESSEEISAQPDKPEKPAETDSGKTPDSLTMELESPVSSKQKEPDLWADLGMLPLFSDEESPSKQ